MPFYIGDYLRDTMHLNTEQHGAYMLLIFAYWMNGPLLDDNDYLSSITKLCRPDWENVRPVMEGFFKVENNFWYHKRIDAELSKANSLSEAKMRAGKAGMEKRWGNRGYNTTITEPITNGLHNDRPSPSPSQVKGGEPPVNSLSNSERITLDKSLGRALERLDYLRKRGPYKENEPQLAEIGNLKKMIPDLRSRLGVPI